MPPIPPSLYSSSDVQTVLLIILIALVLWDTKMLLGHVKRIVRLETVIFNHHAHRFQKLREKLDIDWKDDLENLDDEHERDSITS